ncbi:hypothetical protein BY458DRAFT_493968 [Sporodiniella umbellata]|nr:hypothetical protein BY458DRAFT_493968 [Sporodiniella umbellata]
MAACYSTPLSTSLLRFGFQFLLDQLYVELAAHCAHSGPEPPDSIFKKSVLIKNSACSCVKPHFPRAWHSLTDGLGCAEGYSFPKEKKSLGIVDPKHRTKNADRIQGPYGLQDRYRRAAGRPSPLKSGLQPNVNLTFTRIQWKKSDFVNSRTFQRLFCNAPDSDPDPPVSIYPFRCKLSACFSPPPEWVRRPQDACSSRRKKQSESAFPLLVPRILLNRL